jgi:hypothetical protein
MGYISKVYWKPCPYKHWTMVESLAVTNTQAYCTTVYIVVYLR